MKLGLLGYPLSHSFSPGYIIPKLEKNGIGHLHTYELYPIDSEAYLSDYRMLDLDGFNVTIPYKEKIIPYLDSISNEASAVGAVNCVKKEGDKFVGYNTDVYGFEISLLGMARPEQLSKAIILGTGGAAKAVKFVLKKLGIAYLQVGRHSTPSYQHITREIIDDHPLIINTTPLGMHPDIDSFPEIPYQYLTKKHFLLDLVYNPEKTVFLGIGEAIGCTTKNGMEMLKCQADKSLEIWGIHL